MRRSLRRQALAAASARPARTPGCRMRERGLEVRPRLSERPSLISSTAMLRCAVGRSGFKRSASTYSASARASFPAWPARRQARCAPGPAADRPGAPRRMPPPLLRPLLLAAARCPIPTSASVKSAFQTDRGLVVPHGLGELPARRQRVSEVALCLGELRVEPGRFRELDRPPRPAGPGASAPGRGCCGSRPDTPANPRAPAPVPAGSRAADASSCPRSRSACPRFSNAM